MKTFEQFDDPFGEEIESNSIIPIDLYTKFQVGDQIYTREGRYRGTLHEIEVLKVDINKTRTHFHFYEMTDGGRVERRASRFGLMMFGNKIKKK